MRTLIQLDFQVPLIVVKTAPKSVVSQLKKCQETSLSIYNLHYIVGSIITYATSRIYKFICWWRQVFHRFRRGIGNWGGARVKEHVFMSFECDVLVKKQSTVSQKKHNIRKRSSNFWLGKMFWIFFLPVIFRISVSAWVQNVVSLIKHPTFLSSSVPSNYLETLVCCMCLFFMFFFKLFHMIIGVLLVTKESLNLVATRMTAYNNFLWIYRWCGHSHYILKQLQYFHSLCCYKELKM